MKNLISNTAFGKYLDTLELSLSAYKQVRQIFDSFLLLSLEIWMFVPCKLVDGVWVVLEEPKKEKFNLTNIFDWNLYTEQLEEYQEAKERCLFEGFEVVNSYLKLKGFGLFYWQEHKKIEDIVKYNPTLTPTALKQIGL